MHTRQVVSSPTSLALSPSIFSTSQSLLRPIAILIIPWPIALTSLTLSLIPTLLCFFVGTALTFTRRILLRRVPFLLLLARRFLNSLEFIIIIWTTVPRTLLPFLPMFFLSTTRIFPLFYRIIRITILCLTHKTQIRKTISQSLTKTKHTKIKQKRKVTGITLPSFSRGTNLSPASIVLQTNKKFNRGIYKNKN